jgi:hypothetical protein
MKFKSYKYIILLVLSLWLSACGGGESTSESSSNTLLDTKTTVTGIIVDAQICGLRYESVGPEGEKTHGTTNLKGEYEYFEGGTTTFFVGGIEVAQTTPKKMLSITTLAVTQQEQENIARFLQTLDWDSNPENGILLNNTAINAFDVTKLRFDDNFEADFANVKSQLLSSNAQNISLVSNIVAVEHASKSQRLSSLQEMDLYKAIASEKNYSSEYYNGAVLETDQRKRVYLWIWEKILANEMAIENELATQEFDINKIEEERDRYKKYLDYADSLLSISSLGAGAYEQLAKAGTRSMSYELTQLSSLTANGCSAVINLYDSSTTQSEQLGDSDLCNNMMKILNPVGSDTSKLAVVNPILSSFLPEALPVIMKYKKMNWLHFDTKSLRALSKAGVSKPDLISLGLSLANIANDSAGAYRASNINQELTTRLVAQEWLSLWFRSGFKQEYMNSLINNNATSLVGNKAQIEAIALKFGTSSAYCDAKKFFNPFVDCTGIENINYDYQKVADIINNYLAKSNALYRNIGELTGPLSDEEGTIGVIDIGWKTDENLSDVGESIKLMGKLVIGNLNGSVDTTMPNDLKVRFAQCKLTSDSSAFYLYSLNYHGVVSSDGSFVVDLKNFDINEEDAQACRNSSYFGVYGFQFYRDVNGNNTFDSADIDVVSMSSNNLDNNNPSATHIKIDDQQVNIADYVMSSKEFITTTPETIGHLSSVNFNTTRLLNGKFSMDYYVEGIYNKFNFYIFTSDKEEVYNYEAMSIVSDGNFTATTDDVSKLSSMTKI